MENELIQKIVKATIAELKKSGMLKSSDDIAYREISDVLRSFYHGDRQPKVRQALQTIEDDPYFEIIPLYFQQHQTIEKIAEILDVEVSTVTRNKKRLCLLVHDYIN